MKEHISNGTALLQGFMFGALSLGSGHVAADTTAFEFQEVNVTTENNDTLGSASNRIAANYTAGDAKGWVDAFDPSNGADSVQGGVRYQFNQTSHITAGRISEDGSAIGHRAFVPAGIENTTIILDGAIAEHTGERFGFGFESEQAVGNGSVYLRSMHTAHDGDNITQGQIALLQNNNYASIAAGAGETRLAFGHINEGADDFAYGVTVRRQNDGSISGLGAFAQNPVGFFKGQQIDMGTPAQIFASGGVTPYGGLGIAPLQNRHNRIPSMTSTHGWSGSGDFSSDAAELNVMYETQNGFGLGITANNSNDRKVGALASYQHGNWQVSIDTAAGQAFLQYSRALTK